MITRKSKFFLILICIIIPCILFVNKCNPYLRTDIIRNFAKGNWYIISDKDTIYSLGYFGITKYCIKGNCLNLLKENKNICKDRLFCRAGCIVDNFIYLTMRSYIPGNQDLKNDNKGELIIMKRDNLSVIKIISSDIKLIEVHNINNILVVSGIKGFDIYDISCPQKPLNIFRHRCSKYKEYQGFDIFQLYGKTYVAFSLYGDGIEIWDMTNPSSPSYITQIQLDNNLINGKYQSMDLIADYPYIYATIGPMKKDFNNPKGIKGIIVYNISDLNNIKKKTIEIPKDQWYKKSTGDCQPTYICKYKDRIYTNFSEKGVAIFDISDKGSPQFICTKDISRKNAIIQSINISDSGVIFTGDYYWPNIYSLKIN